MSVRDIGGEREVQARLGVDSAPGTICALANSVNKRPQIEEFVLDLRAQRGQLQDVRKMVSGSVLVGLTEMASGSS